jgi:O-antigen ligase
VPGQKLFDKKKAKIDYFKILDTLLGLTVFLIPFYFIRFKIMGIPTNIFEAGVFLLLIVTLLQVTITKKQYSVNNQFHQNRNSKPFIHYSLFIILLSLSFIIGASRAGFNLDSLGIIKSYLIVPVLFGLAVSYQLSAFRKGTNLEASSQKLKAIFWGLYLSLVAVSVWAIMQKFGVISTLFYQVGDYSFNQYLGENFRAFGPFESPNYLAMYIVPITLLVIGTKSKIKNQKSKLLKGIFSFSLIFPLIALVLTKSRAGLIALAASLSLLGLFWLYSKLKSKAGRVALVSASIILYSLFIILLLKYGLRPESDSFRLDIYQYSWKMIYERPIFGIGIGNFQNYLSNFDLSDSFKIKSYSFAYHPHNLYLALWLNLGLLGLLSFLGLVVSTIRRYFLNNAYNNSSNNAGIFMVLALVSILIHGILDTTYFKNDLAAIFWLAIALIISLSNIKPAGSNSNSIDK